MAQAAARIGCRGPGTLMLCSPNGGDRPHSAKGRGLLLPLQRNLWVAFLVRRWLLASRTSVPPKAPVGHPPVR